ncbi:MAG: methyltransferase [Oscillospiraceae bacterium]|nr:methyltransferase [Oscillospiraceae bacterium]
MPVFTELWPGGPVFAAAPQAPMTTDSVLLAHFVPLRGAERGIDLGCSTGLLTLLLCRRSPALRMVGLELQADTAALGRDCLTKNALADRAQILTGDIRDHRALFPAPGRFDLAVSDPPYFPLGSGARSPDAGRDLARSEAGCSLEELCAAAAWLLRTGGRFCLVHRPERLAELFCCMRAAGLEPKRLRLVQRCADSAPSLALVEGRRGGKPGLRIEPALVLRDAEGRESAAYRRICHREG